MHVIKQYHVVGPHRGRTAVSLGVFVSHSHAKQLVKSLYFMGRDNLKIKTVYR